MSGIPRNAVANLLKTASARIVAQEQELEQLRGWYAEAQTLSKAASVADRMVNAGHLDMSERDQKAVELAQAPDRIPVIEEAISMVADPSTFEVASISNERAAYGGNARNQFESYLLGD